MLLKTTIARSRSRRISSRCSPIAASRFRSSTGRRRRSRISTAPWRWSRTIRMCSPIAASPSIALQRHEEALASLDRALAIRPDYPEALNSRGIVLQEMKRPADALAGFCPRPGAQARLCRGVSQSRPGAQEAGAAGRGAGGFRARRSPLQPDHTPCLQQLPPNAFSISAIGRGCRTSPAALEEHVRDKKSIVSPFVFLGYSGDPALQLRCAETYVGQTSFP